MNFGTALCIYLLIGLFLAVFWFETDKDKLDNLSEENPMLNGNRQKLVFGVVTILVALTWPYVLLCRNFKV